MRKTLVPVVAVIATVLLSGCGHNAITYGDGVGFDAGINPENFTMSFNLRYGKILSAVPLDFGEYILAVYARHVLMSKIFLDYTAQCGYGVKMPRLGTVMVERPCFPFPHLRNSSGL